MAENEWVKCPLCGWHWKREHTGMHAIEKGKLKEAKGEFTFEKGSPSQDAFISLRDMPGGRGNPQSFREIDRVPLEKAKELPEYQNLIVSLKSKIQKISQILY